jgi:hypothetical protein
MYISEIDLVRPKHVGMLTTLDTTRIDKHGCLNVTNIDFM